MLPYCGRTLLEGLIRDLQVLDCQLSNTESYSIFDNKIKTRIIIYDGRWNIWFALSHLKAREFLYFKLYGKQCITPVAIMTSAAKNNHKHVTSLCERLSWFGRGRSTFQLFEQVLYKSIPWLLRRGNLILTISKCLICNLAASCSSCWCRRRSVASHQTIQSLEQAWWSWCHMETCSWQRHLQMVLLSRKKRCNCAPSQVCCYDWYR